MESSKRMVSIKHPVTSPEAGPFLRLRLPLIVVLGVLPLLLSTFIWACAGEGELTLEEYFQRYEALGQEARERAGATQDPTRREFESLQEQLDAYRAFGAALVENATENENRFGGFSPPPELEDLHNEGMAILRDGTVAAEEFLDQLNSVETQIELLVLFEPGGATSQIVDAGERGSQVCRGLQEIADANSVGVDLECMEEE